MTKLRFALLMTLAVSPSVYATNGYFAHGYSPAQRAQGGVATAVVDDSMVISNNPAGISRLEKRFDSSMNFFMPLREFSSYATNQPGLGIFKVEPANVESNHSFFAIPAFSFALPLNDDVSLGLAVFGNGGMNSVFKAEEVNATFFNLNGANNPLGNILGGVLGVPPQNLVSSQCSGAFGGGAVVSGTDTLGFCGNGNGTASVDLAQIFVMPTISFALNSAASVGLSPIFAAQRFEAKGLAAFAPFSNSPNQVTDQGFSFSYGGGVRVGALVDVIESLTFGASWQSRIEMSRFKEYEGLFAEQGGFDIPSSWNVGLAWQPLPAHRLSVDYQYVGFGDVASVGQPLNAQDFVSDCALPRLLGNTAASASCLGADTGPGFGWRDVKTMKFGYQYSRGDWRYRLGYSQVDEQPIPSSEVLFNILAPGVIEEHYTAGVAWQANKHWSFDVSAMYAPTNTVRGRNPLSNVGISPTLTIDASEDANDQLIDLSMKQYELSVGTSYRF